MQVFCMGVDEWLVLCQKIFALYALLVDDEGAPAEGQETPEDGSGTKSSGEEVVTVCML